MVQARKHLLDWIEFVYCFLTRRANDGRDVTAMDVILEQDPLFPATCNNGKSLQSNTAIPSAQITSFLNRCVKGLKAEGVDLLGTGGQFTLHCFRRGGAQHRFFESGRTWSLAAIKRWGGWSEKDGMDTIVNYVLNEWEVR